MYVIVLAKCKLQCWSFHHLHLTQHVCDHAWKVHILLLILLLPLLPTACMWLCLQSLASSLILIPPLLSCSLYVIMLTMCRPLCWSNCHLCLFTARMCLCLQSAYPFTNSVGTIVLPQHVCKHAFKSADFFVDSVHIFCFLTACVWRTCKVQAFMLILWLFLPFYSVFVIMLAKSKPFCWSCEWFGFSQHVCICTCKAQTPLLIL